jgi:hypothetical protein
VIIRVRWNLDLDLPEYMPRFNVAPETWPSIPVIIRQKSGNKCRLMIGVDSALGRRPFYPQSDDERQSRNIDGIAIFQPPGDRRRWIIPALVLCFRWECVRNRSSNSISSQRFVDIARHSLVAQLDSSESLFKFRARSKNSLLAPAHYHVPTHENHAPFLENSHF